MDLGLVISKLGVKVLAVWGSAHGGAENGLDDEGVVRLERVAVGVTEGVRELLGRVGNVVAKGLGGEVEATGGTFVSNSYAGQENRWCGDKHIPGQPQKTFSGSMLLLLELVDDKVLEGF